MQGVGAQTSLTETGLQQIPEVLRCKSRSVRVLDHFRRLSSPLQCCLKFGGFGTNRETSVDFVVYFGRVACARSSC